MRANRLAHHLRSQGAGPEVRVGVILDGPLDQIVAVLGVLKAGGAYVPLEPALPRPRLEAMLDAAGVSIVIVDRGVLERAPRNRATTIELDADWAAIASQSPADPRVRVHGENLAYVVFTSGSTGRAKGVMVSHSGLLAAAVAWEHAYDLCHPPLRHLQAAGFAFDVFTGDWVRALTTGGTLVACPRPVLLDPAALADLIRRERIECLELVPALANALATHLERQGEDLDGIRLLAVGSDTLRGRLYRRLWRLIRPGGRVVNSYGLTEATIDSTYFSGGGRKTSKARTAQSRSAIHFPAPAPTSWTREASRSPRVWSASCTLVDRAWHGDMSPTRDRRPSGTFPIRAESGDRECMRRVTVRAGERGESSSC